MRRLPRLAHRAPAMALLPAGSAVWNLAHWINTLFTAGSGSVAGAARSSALVVAVSAGSLTLAADRPERVVAKAEKPRRTAVATPRTAPETPATTPTRDAVPNRARPIAAPVAGDLSTRGGDAAARGNRAHPEGAGDDTPARGERTRAAGAGGDTPTRGERIRGGSTIDDAGRPHGGDAPARGERARPGDDRAATAREQPRERAGGETSDQRSAFRDPGTPGATETSSDRRGPAGSDDRTRRTGSARGPPRRARDGHARRIERRREPVLRPGVRQPG